MENEPEGINNYNQGKSLVLQETSKLVKAATSRNLIISTLNNKNYIDLLSLRKAVVTQFFQIHPLI